MKCEVGSVEWGVGNEKGEANHFTLFIFCQKLHLGTISQDPLFRT